MQHNVTIPDVGEEVSIEEEEEVSVHVPEEEYVYLKEQEEEEKEGIGKTIEEIEEEKLFATILEEMAVGANELAKALVNATNPIKEDVNHLRQLFSNNNVVSFDIKRIVCVAGSSSGDNYMSVVMRARIFSNDEEDKNKGNLPAKAMEEGRDSTGNNNPPKQASSAGEKYSVIIKRHVPSKSRRQLYRCDEAFANEIYAYNFVVPLMHRYHSEQLFPICHIATHDDQSDTGEPIVVLQDLIPMGYSMEDRTVGLGLEHCKVVMKKLAVMHGASLALKLIQPEDYQKQCENLFEIVYSKGPEHFYKGILESSLKQAIESLRASDKDGSLSETIDCIQRLQEHLFFRIKYAIRDGAKSDMSVICHGDLWVNNIMFTPFNSNNTQDMKAVLYDLQAMRVTSPIFDLLHFFYTSTRRSLRDNYTDHLLALYCKSLAAHLEKQLKDTPAADKLDNLRKTFSVERIKSDYKHHIYYGFAICTWITPAVTFDANNIPDLDEISQQITTSENISCEQNLTTEYHERMRELATEFKDNGLLKNFTKLHLDPDDAPTMNANTTAGNISPMDTNDEST